MHTRRRWLPWTATAALLLGALTTVILLPSSDRALALRGIASSNADARAEAWAWLSSNAPAATRPRVIIMLDGSPDALRQALASAAAQARRDAAVALIAIPGFEPSMLSPEAWTPMVHALIDGSPDEQILGRAIEASARNTPTLHDHPTNVTMP